MEISIIIVNYKTPKLTKACVLSIRKYPPRVSYEVIVIDNSRGDVGFAAANNKGIHKARGKYILLLNSDVEVKEGNIDKIYEFAKSKEDAGAVVPRLLNPDGSIQPSVFNFPTIGRAVSEYFLGQKDLLKKYTPPKTSEVESAVMAAFLITPQAFKKVGLLDEKYYLYFEDLDYCKRIKEAGLKVYYLADAQVVHLHGASGGTSKLLIQSSKKYFGFLRYYIYTFILWLGQKWQKLLRIF